MVPDIDIGTIDMVHIKTPKQIEGIRAAAQVVAKVHKRVCEKVQLGMSTHQVDNVVRHTLRELGAKSAFYKYSQGGKRPFPAYACVSVNEEVVHGIGNHERVLHNGDVLTIDVGAIFNGYYGDAAFTMIVGEGSAEVIELVEHTRAVLERAIEATKAGVYLFDICRVLQEGAEEKGYGIVKEYSGHGVGIALHEPPQIPNVVPKFGEAFNHKLKAGMIITYEPMFTLGSGDTEELEDGWSVVTKDRSTAVHWEHTILVTDDGAEILSK